MISTTSSPKTPPIVPNFSPIAKMWSAPARRSSVLDLGRVGVGGEVQVGRAPAEQQVADWPADQIQRALGGRERVREGRNRRGGEEVVNAVHSAPRPGRHAAVPRVTVRRRGEASGHRGGRSRLSLAAPDSCWVGKRGLEPPTPTMSTWCSNQLSYLPVATSIAARTGFDQSLHELKPATWRPAEEEHGQERWLT